MRLLIQVVALATISQCFPTNFTCDSHSEFDCGVGQVRRCIPLDWQCDHYLDCENGRDEHQCSYVHSCSYGQMACQDGLCVSGMFKCDGDNDCMDGSDERHCKESDHAGTIEHFEDPIRRHRAMLHIFHELESRCDAPRYKCRSGQCISPDLVCDGFVDCTSGDDEEHCLPVHHIFHNMNENDTVPHINQPTEELFCEHNRIKCADNSTCLPSSFYCDGENDCDDGSDENNCEESMDETDFMNGIAEIIQKCTAEGKFHCKPADGQLPTCIPMNATCNGIKECPEGDDESTECTECSNKRCDHTCLNTPHGAQCICQEGYTLDMDGLTCIDEDECALYGHNMCQHFCEDRIGKYVCRCDQGYSLEDDGHSCRLSHGSHEGRLLVSIGSEVRQMALQDAQGTYTTVQRVAGHGTARSIDYFHSIDKVFMSISHQQDPKDGELVIVDKGLIRTLRENMAGIGSIAVDWIGGNIFFTQRAPAKHIGISVCRIDGLFCRWIIQGQEAPQTRGTVGVPSAMQNYRGLVVHPLRGLIIWIDSYLGHNRIMASNMDGTEIRVVLDTKLAQPTGLAIDYIRHDVYFGDAEMKIIERVNLDTKHRSVVVSEGVHHPYDMVVFNGFIYWSDWGSESLKVHEIAHHHQHASTQTMHSFNRFPYGLAVNHSMYQPQSTATPCAALQCPWICVIVTTAPKVAAAKCICPDGYRHSVLENTCIPPNEHEREQMEELSHVSAALMAEYCEAGKACKNGGVCEHLQNEHGRTHRVQCKCEHPFDGEYCERINPELQRLMDERSAQGSFWLVLLVFLVILALFGGVVYMWFAQREATMDAITSARIRVDNMARSAESAAEPIVNKFKHLAGLRSVESSPRAGIKTTNVNFVDETAQPRGDAERQQFLDSPSSFRNPIYDDVPGTASYTQIGTTNSGGSPISGSGVIRFNSEGLF